MRATAMFHALAGTNKIVVENVSYDKAKEKSEIIAWPPKGEERRRRICRRKSIRCDRGKGPQHWRANDVGLTKVFIVAESPRVRG